MSDWGHWMKGAQKVAVTSFCGPGALGNRHQLFYKPEGSDWDLITLPDELRRLPNLILLRGSTRTLRADFWDRGQRVKRCGSGNIAIAAFVHHYLSRSEAFSLRLMTPAGEIQLGHDRFGLFYTSFPEPQYPLTEIAFWRHLLGQKFAAGSLSGGASDYVLLELNRPPVELRLRISQLSRFSRRALIAFYPSGPEHALMRYFAPQYSQNEDSATGSAAVQLAEYLWRRYRWRTCQVRQQSAGGGLIQTEKLGRPLRIGGKAWVNEPKGSCDLG